jgi:hypothetical protein
MRLAVEEIDDPRWVIWCGNQSASSYVTVAPLKPLRQRRIHNQPTPHPLKNVQEKSETPVM